MLSCARFLQVVNSYLETVNDELKGQKEAVDGEQERFREQAGVLQGLDLFEAQQALKEQPKVREELAQLRNQLQTLKQQATEVRSHWQSLSVLAWTFMPSLQHVHVSSQQTSQARERLVLHGMPSPFLEQITGSKASSIAILRQNMSSHLWDVTSLNCYCNSMPTCMVSHPISEFRHR